MNDVVNEAIRAGACADRVNDVCKEWAGSAGLMRYPEVFLYISHTCIEISERAARATEGTESVAP
jgi:hypothetical protein